MHMSTLPAVILMFMKIFYFLIFLINKTILLFFRTNFFMKENKYFTRINFFLPFAYVMILGLFFTESTSKVNTPHG